MNIQNISITDVLSVVVSFLALINAVLMYFITRKNVLLVNQNVNLTSENLKKTQKELEMQEKHNNIMVQPKCNIVSSETNNVIKISIANYGHGIMTIDDIIIASKDGRLISHSLYEIIPQDIKLTYYSVDTQGRDIAVRGHIKLIEITFTDDMKEQYDKVRETLSQYKITVEYHCIYGNKFTAEKDLAILFGKKYRR